MPLPRRLLFEGEEVILDLRPHWWFFAGPASLLAAALVLLVVVALGDVGDWALLAMAGVVLGALVWFAGRYTRWATMNFVLTTDRLIYRSGVVAKRGIEIPLERVNTVFSTQRVFERLLRSGDIVIESGGEQGRQSFKDVPHPSAVRNEIYRQIEQNSSRSPSGVERAPDIVDQIDRLAGLRQRGVITEAEFQAKKSKLLDLL